METPTSGRRLGWGDLAPACREPSGQGGDAALLGLSPGKVGEIEVLPDVGAWTEQGRSWKIIVVEDELEWGSEAGVGLPPPHGADAARACTCSPGSLWATTGQDALSDIPWFLPQMSSPWSLARNGGQKLLAAALN